LAQAPALRRAARPAAPAAMSEDATRSLMAEGAAAVQGTMASLKKGRTKGDLDRAKDYIKGFAMSDEVPEDSPIKQALRCFLKWGLKPLIMVIMFYVWVCKQLYKVYLMLPMNLARMVFGVGLCFFGGVYFTALAAAEAAANIGGKDLLEHLNTVYTEMLVAAEASEKDDKVDADNDKIADVDQMTFNQLMSHKAYVTMAAVSDPMKLQKALVALSTMWMSVLATLKLEFAKTVALAVGIANQLSLPACRLCGPPLAMLMGKDLNHWVHTIITVTVKVACVIVATYVQAYISAFYSGLRGGKIFGESLFNIMSERGWLEKLPDCIVAKPFDANESYLDEVIAYPLAAVGFYCQVQSQFTIMHPFDWFLLPLTVFEWVLRYQVWT